MSDLDEKLKETKHLECPGHAIGPDCIEQIKQAFVEAGWIPIREGVDKYLKSGGDQKYYVVGQDWYDKNARKESLSWALHAVHEHMNTNGYFRDDEHFKSSTITTAELEKVLRKASG